MQCYITYGKIKKITDEENFNKVFLVNLNNKKILLLLSLSLFINFNVKADSFLKYSEFKELMQSDYDTAKWYIRGLLAGNTSHSIYGKITNPNNQKLYCPPKDLKLTIKLSIDIINKEAERLRKDSSKNVEESYVPLLYIWGMQNNFPCK